MLKYGIIIIEKTNEARTIIEEISGDNFRVNIQPRLINKTGILRLGKNKIDLTHVTKWGLFDIRTKKAINPNDL